MQIALVLDDLYAEAGRRSDVRDRLERRPRPTFRVWAPTAQQVTLLTWPAGPRRTRPPRRRRPRTACGRSPTAPGRGRPAGIGPAARGTCTRSTAYQPSTTQEIETNLVTDPYSVALTLNSTRSVAVDLDDRALQPAGLADARRRPTLGPAVDSTIYELHVRDFSIGDQTVPAEHRGSYLAFADDGDGAAAPAGAGRRPG